MVPLRDPSFLARRGARSVALRRERGHASAREMALVLERFGGRLGFAEECRFEPAPSTLVGQTVDARLLDELALAGPEHLDPGYVENYDRKAGFDPDIDLGLLRERGFGAESTLVDLGAGTGTFAFAAASECKRVVAADVSPAMAASMQAKAMERGVRNLECVQAGWLTYEHTGTPPDFVYSRNALHHLPDFWKAIALRQVAELLRPGGFFLLRDIVFAFQPRDAEACISTWLETAAEREEEGWTREELESHVRNEHSTFNWLLEPMIQHAGFYLERAAFDSLRVYASYICVKPSH
jgi:SAM-dependent methyltransferase